MICLIHLLEPIPGRYTDPVAGWVIGSDISDLRDNLPHDVEPWLREALYRLDGYPGPQPGKLPLGYGYYLLVS